MHTNMIQLFTKTLKRVYTASIVFISCFMNTALAMSQLIRVTRFQYASYKLYENS